MLNFGGKITLFLGLFMALFLCSNTVLAADGSLAGTVTDAADDTNVEGIFVYAIDASDNDETESDTTAADGTYSMVLAPGSYVVYTYNYNNSVKYIRDRVNIVVGDGEAVTQDFSLNARGAIAGNIYQSDGVTPIYYAYVYATHTSGSSIGYDGEYTNANGAYELYPSPDEYIDSSAGYHTMYIRRSGYFGAKINNVVVVDGSTNTQNISLTAASTVSGTITDADGVALANALVVLTEDTGTVHTSISAADGTYSISVWDTYEYNGTAIGSYSLTVTLSNYVEGEKDVEITADESSLTGNDFSLSEAGIISGTVYKKNGVTTLSGATVTASDGYGNSYSTTSAADGTYSLDACTASSKYKVTATKDKYLTKTKYNLEVEAGETTTKNFKLTKGKTFSGKIKSKSGTKLKGVNIELFKRDKHYSTTVDYSTTSRNNGRFKITGIDPGYYRVRVELNGYVTKELRKVKLRKNRTGKVYKLTKAASILGQVTNKDEPLRGAGVYVYGVKKNAEVGYANTTTDDDGYYYVTDLKKGKYRIKVLTTEYAYKEVVKTLKTGKQKTVNIKVKKAGAISGYIKDADTNIPLSNYCARIKGTSRYDCTDSNGYYLINGLSPGKYKVYVAEEAYDTQYYNQKNDKVDAKKVEVKANKTKKNINFELTSKDN